MAERESELARCEREIAELRGRAGEPAWLLAMAEADWEAEKRLIEEELRADPD